MPIKESFQGANLLFSFWAHWQWEVGVLNQEAFTQKLCFFGNTFYIKVCNHWFSPWNFSLMVSSMLIYYHWEAMLISFLTSKELVLPFRNYAELLQTNYRFLFGKQICALSKRFYFQNICNARHSQWGVLQVLDRSNHESYLEGENRTIFAVLPWI